MESLARAGGHPNVIRIHDSGVEATSIYFAMELATGGSLRERLGRQRKLPARAAAALLAPVARALAHCHAAGVLHRDVKPENILLDEGGQPKLADLGLARCLESSGLTQSGTLLGTPRYMAPEVFDGKTATAASDVWALGCILFEVLAGRQPFTGQAVHEVAFSVGKGAPRLRALDAEIPRSLDALVAQALARDPGRRPSAPDVATELERFVEHGDVAPRSASPLLLATLGAALLAGAAAAWSIGHGGPPPPPVVAAPPPPHAVPPPPTAEPPPPAISRTELERNRTAVRRLELEVQSLEKLPGLGGTGAREAIRALLQAASTFTPAGAESAEIRSATTALGGRLLDAVTDLWSHSHKLTEQLDAARDIDFTTLRLIPLTGWRRGALLATFARIQPVPRTERALALVDLDPSLVEGDERVPARWRLLFHSTRLQLVYKSWPELETASPGALRASFAGTATALMAAANDLRAADEAPFGHEWAVSLKRAGELYELSAVRRWSDDPPAELATARAFLEESRKLETEDAWRHDIPLARVSLLTAMPGRALELATAMVRRRPGDMSADKLAEAWALASIAALRAGSDQVGRLTDEALSADDDERAAGRRSHVEPHLVRAVLLARAGKFADAHREIDATAQSLASDRAYGSILLTPDQARAEVAALETK